MRRWLGLHWLHILGIGIAAVIFLNFATTLDANRERGQVKEQLDQSQVRTAALAEAVDALIHQVKEAGEQPYIESSRDVVENIPLPKGESGPQGAMGPQGPAPSESQVRQAVEAYLTAHPPEPGRPPTLEEIQGAVSFYCSRFSQCIGEEGEEGEQGERGSQGVAGPAGATGQQGPRGLPGATGVPGVQGTPGIQGLQGLPGPVGPAPTQLQVNIAVAAFCAANNGCKGPAGDAGPAGKDGRGILSMTCASGPKINITVRFTDGTQTVLSC